MKKKENGFVRSQSIQQRQTGLGSLRVRRKSHIGWSGRHDHLECLRKWKPIKEISA
jgi:hypothetical protein